MYKMDSNLILLFGLPTIGKSTITEKLKQDNQISTIVDFMSEDHFFLKEMNSRNSKIPLFTTVTQLSNWSKESLSNQFEIDEFYNNISDNELNNVFNRALDHSYKQSMLNPTKIYFHDCGGMAYSRKSQNHLLIYI